MCYETRTEYGDCEMKKKGIIAATVIILLLAVAATFAVYNTTIYDSIIKDRIADQLEKTYGLSFEVQDIDERQIIVPDFSKSLGFTAYSGEGVFLFGECDWKGKVISESYIHSYYAHALNSELEGIVGNCFDDCYIVEDFYGYAESVEIDLVMANTVTNAEEYKAQIGREKTYFRVYLKEDVTDAQLQNALDALGNSGYKGNVYFIAVKSDLFDELKASKMTCYCMRSSVTEAVSEYVSIDRQELESLIAHPDQYTRAQYVPKWDICEIISR